MFAGAVEAQVDEQGRVVIPQALKVYAGLDRKVSVIGAGDHIELWDVDRWTAHLAKISKDLAQ